MRNHPVFQGPFPVKTNILTSQPTPEAWQNTIRTGKVLVVPLVKDTARSYHNGWITYQASILDSPEVEIMCGGLNQKQVEAGAVWRQGNLLHFAFDLSPAEMNETGQALLLNCVAYIARFTEDRPIATTLSAHSGKAPRRRATVEGLFGSSPGPDIERLNYYFSPTTVAVINKMNRSAYEKWFNENAPFLTANAEGRLQVDETARELDIPIGHTNFFAKCIQKLRDPPSSAKARSLLNRYAPEGPAAGSADDWESWWQESRPYLFFSEIGGYRWYVDPLAKKRGIPSDKLRGPARASIN